MPPWIFYIARFGLYSVKRSNISSAIRLNEVAEYSNQGDGEQAATRIFRLFAYPDGVMPVSCLNLRLK